MKTLKKNVFLFSCLGLIGFAQAQQSFKLQEKDTSASCTYYTILDHTNKEVQLPTNVQLGLECPTLLDLTNSVLTFLDHHTVKQYYLETKAEKTLFITYADIDGISGPVWSKDKSKVMFVSINQQRKHGYRAACRIIVLTLSKSGEILKKQKFDRPINFSCGGICSSYGGEDFMFVGNDTVKYRRNVNMEERPGAYDIIRL